MAVKKTTQRAGTGRKTPTANKRGTKTTARKTGTGATKTARPGATKKVTGRAKTTAQRGKTPRTGATRGNSGQAHMTTDPDKIRQWVQERGGYPATVIGTGDESGTGVLRIDYPGYSGRDTLERISWEEFFQKFEEADLVFLYQSETAGGGPSRFFKLISRQEAQAARS